MFKRLLKLDSRDYLAVVLLIQSFLAIFFWPRPGMLSHFLLTMTISLSLDTWLNQRRFKRLMFPRSGLVTGLIIFLVLDPKTSVLATTMVASIAILSKLIRLKPPKHSFNPAALALVIFSIVFAQPISWWGAAGSFWATPLLIVLVSPILIRLKRLTLPLTFLLMYAAYLLIAFQGRFSLTQVFDPTVIFFALVMLSERITSPSHGHWHYSFGVLTGLMLMVLFYFGRFLGHLDPSLLTLLLANLIYVASSFFKLSSSSVKEDL